VLRDIREQVAMNTGTTSRTTGAETGPGGLTSSAAARPRGSWWLLTALAVCLSLVLGAVAEHVIDQRTAARQLYQTQVLTTISRLMDAEQSQIGRPAAQRSSSAFGNLTDSITGDGGVNGSGTLQVTLGAGSAAQPSQIAFAVTVDSPYGSTTLAAWDIETGHGSASNQGACVLWSTLLGPGRATTPLSLGGGEQLAPCSPRWWAPGPVSPAVGPRLGLAGIPRSPGPGGVG
jgi:hypothetical protein